MFNVLTYEENNELFNLLGRAYKKFDKLVGFMLDNAMHDSAAFRMVMDSVREMNVLRNDLLTSDERSSAQLQWLESQGRA